MSDARSLLRAKKAETEVRISHPYAAYNATGQLRCTVCILNVKNNVAWNGHIGSKAHRTNVAKLKAQEEEAEKKRLGKRKEVENETNDSDESESETKKRRVEDTEEDENSASNKKQSSAFPADFFSDPNRAQPMYDDDDDEEEDSLQQPIVAPAKTEVEAAVDREWEEFQRTVLNQPTPREVIAATDREQDKRETWDRATVFAEPELVSETPEGFPTLATESQPEAEEVVPELDERAIAEKRAADDRELIMDRLLDEERAQEEADGRVATLKARLEGLKKRKEAARLLKAKT